MTTHISFRNVQLAQFKMHQFVIFDIRTVFVIEEFDTTQSVVTLLTLYMFRFCHVS